MFIGKSCIFLYVFSFTYTAVSRTEIATTADVSADANSPRNRDVPSGSDVNIRSDAPKGINKPSSTDIITIPNTQVSTDAPGSTHVTTRSVAPASEDAFSNTDVSTSDDAPTNKNAPGSTYVSTSVTVKPTAMATTAVPTTCEVFKATSTTPITVPIVRDCSDILEQGYTEINYGIYRIQPSGDSESFQVVCDLKTNGHEWIVFQRRFDGCQNFYLPWEDYKNGFGSLTGEHWLGLEKLHSLTTNGVWQLRVDMEDFSGNTVYAEYSKFAIGDESTYYKLSIGEYSGNAGDSLTYHANMAFSTYDKNHDISGMNCAERWQGAYWYSNCYHSNLNGRYLGSPVEDLTAMMWNGWKWEVLKKSEMKIRRV